MLIFHDLLNFSLRFNNNTVLAFAVHQGRREFQCARGYQNYGIFFLKPWKGTNWEWVSWKSWQPSNVLVFEKKNLLFRPIRPLATRSTGFILTNLILKTRRTNHYLIRFENLLLAVSDHAMQLAFTVFSRTPFSVFLKKNFQILDFSCFYTTFLKQFFYSIFDSLACSIHKPRMIFSTTTKISRPTTITSIPELCRELSSEAYARANEIPKQNICLPEKLKLESKEFVFSYSDSNFKI